MHQKPPNTCTVEFIPNAALMLSHLDMQKLQSIAKALFSAAEETMMEGKEEYKLEEMMLMLACMVHHFGFTIDQNTENPFDYSRDIFPNMVALISPVSGIQTEFIEKENQNGDGVN